MTKSDSPYRFFIFLFTIFLLPIGGLQAATVLDHAPFHSINSVSSAALPDLSDTLDCEVKVAVKHISIFYKDITSPEFTGYPKVSSTCGAVAGLNYQDESHTLTCSPDGQGGYFSTERWEVSKIIGDGGVDVTGAPNSALVEGASVAQVKAATGSWTQFKIEIPVEGYLTFSLRNIGGSHLIGVRINDTMYPLPEGETYFSDLLHPGDLFALWLPGEEHDNLSDYLNEFQPITNSMGVISRSWQVGSTEGVTTTAIQYIALEKGSLANIIIPDNLPQRNISRELVKPEFTGYPVLDKDGNPGTTDDQTLLELKDTVYKVQWADEIIKKGNRQLLLRHWQITDTCAESIMNEIQVIPLEEGDLPEIETPVENPTRSSSTSIRFMPDKEEIAPPVN